MPIAYFLFGLGMLKLILSIFKEDYDKYFLDGCMLISMGLLTAIPFVAK